MHPLGEARWGETPNGDGAQSRANEFMRCITEIRERGPVKETDFVPKGFDREMMGFLQDGAATFNGILANNFEG